MPRLSRCLPALLAIAAMPAAAEVPLDVVFDSELYLDGLFQFDKNVFDSDRFQFADDAEFRRAEIVLRGKHSSGFEYTAGWDAKADKWLDLWGRHRLGAYTTLRAGQYKQPNSLEELGSTKNNDFISKSMATNTFAVARRLGVEMATEGRNWTLTGSAFGRELTASLGTGAGYGARATWAPLLEDVPAENTRFAHLGVAAVSYDTTADTLRLRARPGADLAAQRLVDTGNLVTTDRITAVSVEGAYGAGPLLLQGEYYQATVDRYTGGDFDANAWYVYGLWTLTGEAHGYKQGVVTTPFPSDPVKGMWQIGLRYEGIDLDDGTVLGGEENNLTLGVNWYWHTNFKFMANYVQVDSERRGIEDNPNIIEFRGQLMF
jgi:phosphate-selective porin OprO/OprP